MNVVQEFKPPVVELLQGGKTLRLADNFLVFVYLKPVRIPAGFASDGASVPWVFTHIVPRTYGTAAAAIVHDAIYSTPHHYRLSRKQADNAFRCILVMTGLSRIRARVAWLGVRIGGKLAWNRKNELDG